MGRVIGKAQALRSFAILEIRGNEFIHIGYGRQPHPDALRISDDARPLLAAVETASGVYSDAWQIELLDTCFHVVSQTL